MQPAFTAEAIASTMPLMTQIMETYLSKWESASGPVPGAAEIKALTFDIILQVGVVPSAIFVGVWAAALPVVCESVSVVCLLFSRGMLFLFASFQLHCLGVNTVLLKMM